MMIFKIFICFLIFYIECQEHVFSFIQQYSRPITFLLICDNIDEQLTEFIQEKSSHVFVLLSSNNVKILPFSNLIYLNHNYTLHDLNHLSECEHFDIVFIDHSKFIFNQEAVRTFYNLGENVFIKIGHNEPTCNYFNKIFHLIHFTESNKLFFAQHKITYLKRNQWLEPSSDLNCVRKITSTFYLKQLTKEYGLTPIQSTWLPGINLMTFKMLTGKFPTASILKHEIKRLFYINHPDWMPNNIIVKGTQLELIDFKDPWSDIPKTVQNSNMLHLVEALIQENNSLIIPQLFQNILIYCRNILHP